MSIITGLQEQCQKVIHHECEMQNIPQTCMHGSAGIAETGTAFISNKHCLKGTLIVSLQGRARSISEHEAMALTKLIALKGALLDTKSASWLSEDNIHIYSVNRA